MKINARRKYKYLSIAIIRDYYTNLNKQSTLHMTIVSNVLYIPICICITIFQIKNKMYHGTHLRED